MKYIIPICLAISFSLQSCKQGQTLKEKQSEITHGKIDNNLKYTCNEIGWQTYLPKDWNVMTKSENDTLNKKGMDLIEKSSGIKVDASGLKELVNLKKDPFNCFISTIEHYDEEKDGNYAEHNVALYKIIADAFKNQNIRFAMTQDSEVIDKIKFYTLQTTIYKPQSDKILIIQKMYSQLLNGYDFGITIDYNNEKDKEILMRIINNSKFLQ